MSAAYVTVLVVWAVVGVVATIFAILDWPYRHSPGGMMRIGYFIGSACGALAMCVVALVAIA